MRRLLAVLTLLALPLAAGAQSTCTLQTMKQDSLAPADLSFPFPISGEQIPVTIDAAAGTVSFDFGALPVLNFPNTFSQDSGLDTIDFLPGASQGTIDAGGNIVVPHVRGINCTQGKCPVGQFPCPCIPGNLCSNDPLRVCVAGATSGDLSCPPLEGETEPGVCRGVCSNDRSESCASSADCTPPGFCGEGVGMRVDATFSTGATTFEGFTLLGSNATTFSDGQLGLVSVHSTPPETYAIGDTGVSSLEFTCDLDPVPTATGLPAAAWLVQKGTVKLGKGAPGDGDDKLSLKASFAATGGTADFAAGNLSITLANDDGVIVTLTAPAGSLVASKKGNKWKLVDKDGSVVTSIPPPPDGFTPSHKINIKQTKAFYSISVSSKNLNLDGADVTSIVTGVAFGEQTPSARSAVTAKGQKRSF